MKREMYRQGDVLLMRIDKLPKELTERRSRIIVEGEKTGHHHSLVAGRVLSGSWLGELFLEVPQATQVVHQDHRPLHLPPGSYRVTRQREYVAPDFDREVRNAQVYD